MGHPPAPSGASVDDGHSSSQASVRELIAHFDWASTPLGPISGWPDSLKTSVRIMVTSVFPMWMAWGPELTMLYNDSYARTTLSQKHPWALGRRPGEVWHEIWKEILPLIEQVMETGEALWKEKMQLFLERNKYQEETFHTFSYSPLSDSDGRVVGMLCVVMEETERVIGERQLATLSTLGAALAETITEGDVLSAIERLFVGQSDMPCTLTYLFECGSETLRLAMKTGFDGDHPAATETLTQENRDNFWPISKLLAANEPVMIDGLSERIIALPAGPWNKCPQSARLVPLLRQGQEKPIGIFIAALNPYRRLNASYAGFLDLVAGQIAAALNNAQAYEVERRRAESLAELDRAKTTFFSNVSHELRTPLTLILGPVEDAITGQTPPSPAALEMLHRNALRLLRLVNGLLDFVRIEVGRLRANYEETNLSIYTGQLASVFRSAVERAGLKLIVDCAPLPEPIFVDREMWEKIVFNLLSNALKSTFDGEIRVEVAAVGHSAELRVTDTGTGISAENLAHLFERFRRIDGAKRRSHEGSGIGLALVRELVEMHGGTIRVESKLGQGTTFSVLIPFGRGHLSQEQIVVGGSGRGALPGAGMAFVQEAMGWLPGREHLREDVTRNLGSDAAPAPDSLLFSDPHAEIVVVDDNADMREYVLGLLGGRFRVRLAENGVDALKQIRERAPDLVLTDVMMPEMDGFALLAALREDSATRNIPVIMLSARAGDESRIEGMEAGADDYLAKPFTARELIARVEAQLKLARVRRDAMTQEAALTHELYKARQSAVEALEHIPEVFYLFDSQLRFTYVNATGRTVSDRLGKPFLGVKLFDVVPDLIGSLVETNLRRSLEEGVSIEFEYYYAPLESWYHYRAYPQPDNGLALYARNVTEAKKTEEALRNSEQLAAAGRLAASIAHEINNPLEAVTNLLFLARMDQTIAGDTKKLIDMADKELQRLSHIAARSLKFYRQRTAPAETSIEELIESVLFFHETDIRTRGLDLDRRYRPAPKLLCQPGEIQQVMTNLIDNALDALKRHGRMIIGVRVSTNGLGKRGIAVTVADSGSGIDPATRARLFHPFITTKGEEGNGLGLWLSKGIIEKHRGTIRVRSRRDVGSVFRVFLPLESDINEPARS